MYSCTLGPLSHYLQIVPRSDAAQKKPPKLKTFVCSQTGMRVAYEGAGSVIFDRKLAERFYTPARMYAENKRREEKSSSAPMTVDGPRQRTRTKKGKQKRNSTAAAGRTTSTPQIPPRISTRPSLIPPPGWRVAAAMAPTLR